MTTLSPARAPLFSRATRRPLWRAVAGLCAAGTLSLPAAALDVPRNLPRCVSRTARALDVPADVRTRADTYYLRALCLAKQGEVDGAEDAFMHVLMLEPSAELDPLHEEDEDISTAFAGAQGAVKDLPRMRLRIERAEPLASLRIVRIALRDPLELVHTVTWQRPGGAPVRPLRAAALMELEVPTHDAVELVALDRGGAVLLRAPLDALVEDVELAPVVPAAPTETPLLAQPWVWVTGGAVVTAAVAAGVVAGVAAQPPQTRLTATARIESATP